MSRTPPWTGADRPPVQAPFDLPTLPASPVEAARALLGAVLVSDVGGVRTSGVIVETEAYIGPADPASHAAARIGRTARNATMFGPAGTAYVYRIYGLHDCVNVVTGPVGRPLAVLVRALHPLEGRASMARRRDRADDLCSGPARLCRALGITLDLDGHPLDRPPLHLTAGWDVAPAAVRVGGRVGISRAGEWPLRFSVRDEPAVSRARGRPARRSSSFLDALATLETS
ncbi:MAG: DNA-3-methyladenine glycosylase [Gemmatimonadota bacterium]